MKKIRISCARELICLGAALSLLAAQLPAQADPPQVVGRKGGHALAPGGDSVGTARSGLIKSSSTGLTVSRGARNLEGDYTITVTAPSRSIKRSASGPVAFNLTVKVDLKAPRQHDILVACAVSPELPRFKAALPKVYSNGAMRDNPGSVSLSIPLSTQPGTYNVNCSNSSDASDTHNGHADFVIE